MKKSILILALTTCSFAFAQWSESGSNVYTTNSGNNVGIGTSSPISKLHVEGNNPGGDIALTIKNANGNTVGTSTSINFITTSTSTVYGAIKAENVGVGLGEITFLTRGGGSGAQERMRIARNGNIGIGTSDPTELLQIDTGFSFHVSGHSVLGFYKSSAGDLDATKYSGEVRFNPGDGILSFGTSSSITANVSTRMSILNNGNVGIGLSNPSEKLTVDGKILCEEVEVVLDAAAPDYVFQKYYTGSSKLKNDYKMPTLEEVEAFTKANHHLPEVPSAKELKEEGLQLKEMTTILLQKVEELTLYTIEQEKRIKSLEAKLAEKK